MKPKLGKSFKFMASTNKSDSGIGPSPAVAKEFVSNSPMKKKKMFAKKVD